MSRDLPAELEAAIEATVVRPFLAVFIDLPDPVRVFSGSGTISFEDADGVLQEWIGHGGFGALDTISEATDGSATGVKATLFNIPSEFRDDIADQATQGARFEVYFGAFNTDFQTIEATALVWKGRVDTYKITDAGDSITVEVAGESRAIDQRRPAIKRFTDEYQQRKYPGDLFFQYVPQMAEIPILWAQAEQKTSIQSAVAAGGGGFAGSFLRAVSP